MNQMRKLATKEDLKASVDEFFTPSELVEREKDYLTLSPEAFSKKERGLWSRPVTFNLKEKSYTLQLNHCCNPFCSNFGKEQLKFDSIKGKPSRYKLTSKAKATGETGRLLECTKFSNNPNQASLRNSTSLLSNRSLADEIIRLSVINSVVPNIFKLNYHNEGCCNAHSTPQTDKKSFYKRGKSKVGAQRYQCKECGKTTNEQPKQSQSFSYHQQRNEEVINIFNDLINRTPVIGTLRKNEIGASTYYNKLEWIYRKCLEFLERHEAKPLENKEFNSLYVCTDALTYNLNYKRLRSDGQRISKSENKLPTTNIFASADVLSGYVFRSDVSYDFLADLEEIEKDTQTYFCDHSAPYGRKNERLRHEYAPQPPSPKDTQTKQEYLSERTQFEDKQNYVDGLHVKANYTCVAHLWLLRQSLNAKQHYFVTDGDTLIQNALYRVYPDVIKAKNAHVIQSQVDKTLTLQQAGTAYFKQRNELIKWAKDWGYEELNISAKVRAYLEEELAYHNFYEEKVIDGVPHKYSGTNAIKHPLPFMDEGHRYITCLTDVTDLGTEELARILSKINTRAVDDFFQKIHRSISTLERPLSTSRGDGKSYIYANYNPKYAQYAITILRVYYNFCLTNKRYGEQKTPAQRLGITDKVFTIKDIVYFK